LSGATFTAASVSAPFHLLFVAARVGEPADRLSFDRHSAGLFVGSAGGARRGGPLQREVSKSAPRVSIYRSEFCRAGSARLMLNRLSGALEAARAARRPLVSGNCCCCLLLAAGGECLVVPRFGAGDGLGVDGLVCLHNCWLSRMSENGGFEI